MRIKQLASLLLTVPLATAAFGAPAEVVRTPSPDEAKAYIISPEDGDRVPETFPVVFGISGMGVAPAGVDRPDTGHHHLLIDMDELPLLDQPMSSDIKHFGGGQTETQVTLPPGKHSLQLLLGDMNHIPHDPPVMSEKITITVE